MEYCYYQAQKEIYRMYMESNISFSEMCVMWGLTDQMHFNGELDV